MRVGLFYAGPSKKISALYSPKPANREKWEASVDGKCLTLVHNYGKRQRKLEAVQKGTYRQSCVSGIRYPVLFLEKESRARIRDPGRTSRILFLRTYQFFFGGGG
jgi:hypothetical protein